jgi:hypothetical protein
VESAAQHKARYALSLTILGDEKVRKKSVLLSSNGEECGTASALKYPVTPFFSFKSETSK